MLSKGELRRVYTIVAAHPDGGTELADRMESMIDSDVVTEVRALRWQTVGLMALMMVINAGMVGLGLSLGMGQWAVNVTPGAPVQSISIKPEPLMMMAPDASKDAPSAYMFSGAGGSDSILIDEAYFEPSAVEALLSGEQEVPFVQDTAQ